MSAEIYNTTKTKQLNTELVIKTLSDLQPYTRKKIADVTGLSVATCGNILKDLIQRDEVFELDEEESSGGRPAKYYVYNPDHSLIAGLYITIENGRYCINEAVANRIGEVLDQETIEHSSFSLELVDQIIDRLLKKHAAIKAVGIGIPGVVINGKVGDVCDIQELVDCPLEEILNAKYKVKFIVENDMNLIALGFYRIQGFKNLENVAVINFPKDSCGGSGLIIDGHILKGKSNFAGEISYLPLGVARNKLVEWMNQPDESLQMIVQTLVSIIAIINPATIALTGELVHSDRMNDIIEGCRKIIPGDHMPDIIYRQDIQDEYINGLIAVTQNSLSCDIQLVRKRI